MTLNRGTGYLRSSTSIVNRWTAEAINTYALELDMRRWSAVDAL